MNDRSSARPAAAFAVRPAPPKKPVRPSARPVPMPRRSIPAAPALEPTILLVGADSVFEPALRAALARHRVYVETTTAESVAETVIAAAPDLVLLVGPAARGGDSLGVVGEATLSEFVGALSRELRSGILSVHTGKGGDDDAVRLVLGS